MLLPVATIQFLVDCDPSSDFADAETASDIDACRSGLEAVRRGEIRPETYTTTRLVRMNRLTHAFAPIVRTCEPWHGIKPGIEAARVRSFDSAGSLLNGKSK